MKFYGRGFVVLVVAWIIVPTVIAGPSKPEIVVGINSESLDKGILKALEPSVKWQTSSQLAGCDVEGGLAMAVTTEKETIPYSLWARIKKTVGGVDLSARVDTDSSELNQFDLDLQASKGYTTVQVKATANSDDNTLAVQNIQLNQKLDAAGGTITLIPKYTIASKKPDIKVKYGISGTLVTLEANRLNQKITLSQSLGDNVGTVTPSVTSEGDFDLEYSRKIGSGVLTVAYQPKESLGITYEDGPWVATVKTPVDGGVSNFCDRVKVNVRRSVDVMASAP